MRSKNKIRNRSPIGKFFLIVFVVCAVAFQIYPIFWIFMSSLKTSEDFITNPAYRLPEMLYFNNYIRVIFESGMPRFFLNSVIVASITLLALAFLGSLAGFALSKMVFKGKNIIFLFFMAGITIPIFVSLIPMFQIYNALGLRNTYISLILPQVGFGIPISMFLYMGFMDFIPSEMEESAYLDGATPFTVYRKIIMPMSTNATITVLTFNFVMVWNEYTFAHTFISQSAMRTLPIGLTDFLRGMGMRDWGQTFAAISVSILPTLIIYFILNDKIMGGMTAGAVKG